MTIGKRLAFGLEPWEFGLGLYFSAKTLWLNLFGFYLNFYFGKVED